MGGHDVTDEGTTLILASAIMSSAAVGAILEADHMLFDRVLCPAPNLRAALSQGAIAGGVRSTPDTRRLPPCFGQSEHHEPRPKGLGIGCSAGM
jgi:hypothetical protein